jgi:hypothetical protein
MSDGFGFDPTNGVDPAEQQAADRLDASIDASIDRGTAVDPVVAALLAERRVDVPAPVLARVGAVVSTARPVRGQSLREQSPTAARARRHAQIAAAVLGFAFFNHATGQLFLGHWVARQTHGVYDAHSYVEGGVALLALAAVLATAVRRSRWLDVAALAGVPAGLAYAVHGAAEITGLTWGGLLHGSEGLAAVALFLTWWRARRYARPPDSEEET